jgi:hypothetical protein
VSYIPPGRSGRKSGHASVVGLAHYPCVRRHPEHRPGSIDSATASPRFHGCHPPLSIRASCPAGWKQPAEAGSKPPLRSRDCLVRDVPMISRTGWPGAPKYCLPAVRRRGVMQRDMTNRSRNLARFRPPGTTERSPPPGRRSPGCRVCPAPRESERHRPCWCAPFRLGHRSAGPPARLRPLEAPGQSSP